jgi:hypothetical protein
MFAEQQQSQGGGPGVRSRRDEQGGKRAAAKGGGQADENRYTCADAGARASNMTVSGEVQWLLASTTDTGTVTILAGAPLAVTVVGPWRRTCSGHG